VSRQHDAHVRARSRLLRRIVARMYEWKSNFRKVTPEQMLRQAEACLAAFRWPAHDWQTRRGAYYAIDGAAVIGQYKDVPARIVHSIMCTEVPR
jgi:hypothetical protein